MQFIDTSKWWTQILWSAMLECDVGGDQEQDQGSSEAVWSITRQHSAHFTLGNDHSHYIFHPSAQRGQACVSVVRDCQLSSKFPTRDSPPSQQCSWVRKSGCLLIIETKYDSYNFPNKRIADAALAPLMSCTIFYFAQLRLQHDWEQNLLIALNGFLENLK